MGMGEPLNNYDNVVEACRCLIDRKRWNMAHGRVTVSTVGVTPRIRDLTRDLPEVGLALSLHAPNQAMRSEIVPAAKAYKIEGLIEALDNHMMAYLKKRQANSRFTEEERIKESTRRRAMIEYVMCKYAQLLAGFCSFYTVVLLHL
jgi:sorting nexin-8